MPELSIVIAAIHGEYDVDSLLNNCKIADVEIILVQARGQPATNKSNRVKYVCVQPGNSERQMRLNGIQQATGTLIAILGDRYELGQNWIQVALANTKRASYGSVLPAATLSRSGWAIYLAEYSYTSGPIEGNTVYQKFSHGHADPLLVPGLSVFFSRPPSWRQYLRERYCNSLEWARKQSADASSFRRLLNAASRVTLPPLLIWRRAQGQYPRRFVAALPYLLVSSCVEATGEIAGFLLGEQ